MFEHPAHIPVPVALAVHSVMHNAATQEDWELLDKYPSEQLLGWVQEICEANNWQRISEELAWWKDQLGTQTFTYGSPSKVEPS